MFDLDPSISDFAFFFGFYSSFLRQQLVLLMIVIMYHENSLKDKNQILFCDDEEYLSFPSRIIFFPRSL